MAAWGVVPHAAAMRVHVEDTAQLPALSAWLSERGWPVVDVDDAEADVLLPWEQDEFAAALRLRNEVAVWSAAHGSSRVSVDRDVWADAPHAVV